MIICISLQALSFSAFVMRMDWKKAAEEVRLVLLLTGEFLRQYDATAFCGEARVKRICPRGSNLVLSVLALGGWRLRFAWLGRTPLL